MKVGYFAPSYKRPYKSTTQKLYPFVKLVVMESEAEEYRKNGNDIVVCPDGAQGNLCRVRNWILDNPAMDFDAVVIMDDDFSGLKRTSDNNREMLFADEVEEFCENAAIMTEDCGFAFFGVNPDKSKGGYREHTPLSMLKYIRGPFQGFIKIDGKYPLRYDENLPLKEDYDMTLQAIYWFGGCLRFNFMSYDVKQAEQAGGCATYRTSEREKEQFEMLQRKWGSKIVRYDSSSKKGFDFNPIIKVPIRGV